MKADVDAEKIKQEKRQEAMDKRTTMTLERSAYGT